MAEKKDPPPAVPLCRFEKLAGRENRLREEKARRDKPGASGPCGKTHAGRDR